MHHDIYLTTGVIAAMLLITYLGCIDPFGGSYEAGMGREGEKERIAMSFEEYLIPPEDAEIIMEAMNSTEWDWYVDTDGCTGVSNQWPTKYSPPCLVHDWMWQSGRGGAGADRVFLRLMLDYKVPVIVAYSRYIGVRIAWYMWFKWRLNK